MGSERLRNLVDLDLVAAVERRFEAALVAPPKLAILPASTAIAELVDCSECGRKIVADERGRFICECGVQL